MNQTKRREAHYCREGFNVVKLVDLDLLGNITSITDAEGRIDLTSTTTTWGGSSRCVSRFMHHYFAYIHPLLPHIRAISKIELHYDFSDNFQVRYWSG